jgi:hypothetical protein
MEKERTLEERVKECKEINAKIKKKELKPVDTFYSYGSSEVDLLSPANS